ncbi:hypothetical protein [Nocardia salmonicida]|uniref:hypothetical protein n=1 Tax=Nocardia salmonicida TaxID=53431 RepID=UPI000B33AE7A|nr:hypothetical protein [Nocardia salmonicida]
MDVSVVRGLVMGHIAAELDAHIPEPFSIEATGEHLTLLEVRGGRARLVSSASLSDGLDRLESGETLARQLGDFRDDVAMALRDRWPLAEGAGGEPEVVVTDGVLSIRFLGSRSELRLPDLRLDGLEKRISG